MFSKQWSNQGYNLRLGHFQIFILDSYPLRLVNSLSGVTRLDHFHILILVSYPLNFLKFATYLLRMENPAHLGYSSEEYVTEWYYTEDIDDLAVTC